jgi:hypothetical protein
LRSTIGEAGETIVYLYGACDRVLSYPTMAGPRPVFSDRFSGEEISPAASMIRDFVELTVANEPDVMQPARLSPIASAPTYIGSSYPGCRS